jgi:hypothetical protein
MAGRLDAQQRGSELLAHRCIRAVERHHPWPVEWRH